MLWVFDGLLSISLIDHRCCFCCQANPAGRESGHTGNMGELDCQLNPSVYLSNSSGESKMWEKRTACGKFGNAMFLVVGILRVLISKARQEACFRVSFLLVCIVRSWSHIFCLTQDTAGSERYEAMSRIYYRGARAAIVCYGKTLLFFNIP